MEESHDSYDEEGDDDLPALSSEEVEQPIE
jgi:hypothetical protein